MNSRVCWWKWIVLCTSERDSRCSCGCIFPKHRGGHNVARQQAFYLKCITDFMRKEKMTVLQNLLFDQGKYAGKKTPKKHGQHRWRGTQMYWDYFWVHPEILQFDFSPSIIIPLGKHNAICSQKNYTTALQKTNNLLALCLTEQQCQSARNHPF